MRTLFCCFSLDLILIALDTGSYLQGRVLVSIKKIFEQAFPYPSGANRIGIGC
jgi:hypothetical protein